jgi:hypothetical protein
MLYKYINENRIESAPNPLFVDGKAYSNPTDETLRMLGYKDLVVQDMPEVPDGKMAIPVYTDGEVITQGWEIIDDVEN